MKRSTKAKKDLITISCIVCNSTYVIFTTSNETDRIITKHYCSTCDRNQTFQILKREKMQN